jgi:DNA mismatch repair protein MutL
MAAFERIVLVYPDIAFSLHSNGTEMLNVRKGTLRQRISDVFGHRYSQDLLPVEVHTSLCTLTGFVGKPETARQRALHQFFFVNGRFMKHPYFHKAVINAFERLIPEGTQVPYFIYFEVAPADIDVNIHPTKTEIKFENEQAIWQILSAAVKEAIGRFCEVPTIMFDTEGKPDIPVFNPSSPPPFNPSSPSFKPAAPSYNPFATGSGSSVPRAPKQWQTLYEGLSDTTVPDATVSDTTTPAASAVGTLLQDKSPAHYQYKGRYIMTAVKSGLMIIDQHRASVRVMYERYIQQHDTVAAVPQRVLFPETLQFSPAEVALLQQLLPTLTHLGFELTDLGGNTYTVNAIPSGIDTDPVSLVRNIIADAAEHDLPGIPASGAGAASAPAGLSTGVTTLALTLARHTAIPYGQILSNDEMEAIVNQLFSCSNVNYTPDGHSVLTILPEKDIEQLFG